MKKSGQKPPKQDHLSPTKIKEPKPVKGPEKSKNLTHGEVQNRLKVYDRVGHLMHQHNVVQDIKERYQSTVQTKQQTYTKQDINYSAGVRKGLPHTSYETMRTSREVQDQNFRNTITKEAKERYREKDNLTKKFNDLQPSAKQLRQNFSQAKQKGAGRKK